MTGDSTAGPVSGGDGLTAAWCTVAMGGVLDGATVTDVELTPVGTGQVADTYRLTFAYDREGAGPPTAVAKVPAADATSRMAAQMTRTYEIEASFYRDLAADLPVRAPACYHAAHDVGSDDYVVLLEDVAPAEQGDQLAGCSVDDVAAAVDEMALLHGPRWGDPTLLDIGWLHRSQPENIDYTVGLFTDCGPIFLQRYAERLRPATAALVERVIPRLGPYLHDRSGPMTIAHGDFRADNLLFGADRVVVVDWQTVGVGPGTGDLAYLLGASILPELRRRHERDLVARYADGLRAQGAAIDDDELWLGYRRAAFGSLLMAIVASALVAQTDRGDDMFMAMAERPADMIADLDAESLLSE